MSTDENKNSGNNTNTAQDINPVSRYFTIVIYGLMFVLGTILLVRIVGSFNNTVKLLGQALQVIAPFLVGAFIAFILYPLVRFFYRNLFKNTLHMKSDKLSKWLSILVTYVIAIGVIAILMSTLHHCILRLYPILQIHLLTCFHTL